MLLFILLVNIGDIMKFKWERINQSTVTLSGWTNTFRAKVIGGWIIKEHTFEPAGDESEEAHGVSISLVFIPDQNHEWVIT